MDHSVIVWPGYQVGFKMATFIAKFKIGALKNNFRVLPFGISKFTEKLVFMYSSLMTELKKEIARYFSEQNFRLHSKVYTTSLERKETDSSDFERSRVCFTQPN